MARLQLHRVMQTNVADRVVKDTWSSRVDISGSIFENSTVYNFLFFNYVDSSEDFEAKRRFYHSRNLTLDVRPHKFSFRVWLQSMSLRYFIEMSFFAANVVVFQYYISNFNTNHHLVNGHLKELIKLGILEMDSQGRIRDDATIMSFSSNKAQMLDIYEI